MCIVTEDSQKVGRNVIKRYNIKLILLINNFRTNYCADSY